MNANDNKIMKTITKFYGADPVVKEEPKEEAPKPTATTEAASSPVKSPTKVPDPPAVEDTESGTTSEAGKKVEVESAKVGSPQPLPPPTGKRQLFRLYGFVPQFFVFQPFFDN